MKRSYSALRNAEPLVLSPVNTKPEPTFIWTGDYVQPVAKGKFEIFVYSSTKKNEVLQQRAALDDYGTEFDGRPVVGVIRPPLGSSPYYGLVLGLLRETGQVQFTFDDTTSQRLCRFALDVREVARGQAVIDVDVFRYENQPRPPGTPKFRFCRDLVSSAAP